MSSSRWAVIVATVALVGGGCVPAGPAGRSGPIAVPTSDIAAVPTTAVPTAVVAAVPTAVVRATEKRLSNDLLMVETAQGLAAFDWATSRLVFQVPNAVPSPDWSQLVVSAADGNQATLNVLDSRTGAQKSSVEVPVGLAAVTISTDGHRVALAPATADGAWQPVGREQTRIVVADPSGTAESLTFDLHGNYMPDAFANDGQHLFVLEYLPPMAPERYWVRTLDLKTGVVSGVGSRFKLAVPAPEEEMRGTRRMQVLSPNHQVLYTLYTNQPEHLHSRDLAAGMTQSTGDVSAFVHVLNLSEGWAYCLDLPQPFGEGAASAHALALSPGGRWLYVSDRSSGKVALVDTSQLIVRGIADVGADPRASSALAATLVGPNGSVFLASSAPELIVLEPNTLAVQRHLAMPSTPTGLGVSLDGRRLFVSMAGRLSSIDPLTGSELDGFAAAGAQRIEHVGQL